jgi:hypothetical protein
MFTIKIDLGIEASQFIQHVQLHNEQIEAQIEKGINAALEEIVKGDNFSNSIKEATIQEIKNIVHKRILSYDIQKAIGDSIREKVDQKIALYADGIAEKITQSLK